MRFPKMIVTMLAMMSMVASASVQKDFMRIWDGRAQQYIEQRPALDERTQRSAAAAVQSITTGQPTAGEYLGSALIDARALSALIGRYQTLWQLRQHMAKKPSSSQTDAWMQSQLDELKARAAAADQLELQVKRSAPGRDVPLIEWVGAIESLAQKRGYGEGAAAELKTIDENLRSYYVARAEEHERAVERRATIILALLTVLAAQQAATSSWSVNAVSGSVRMAPNGRYVGGSGTISLCPDGGYVAGQCRITPNGDYVGGTPRLAPNGRYVGVNGDGRLSLCPDGSYVGGACHLAPNGAYVGD